MSGSWINHVVGDTDTQFNNALRLGHDNNTYTGNAVLPRNFSGTFIGGRKKHGGSIAGILGTAATPLSLLALQNQYKGKRNIFSRKYSGSRRFKRSRRSRKSRSSRRR